MWHKSGPEMERILRIALVAALSCLVAMFIAYAPVAA
jgi:hypothetical protein